LARPYVPTASIFLLLVLVEKQQFFLLLLLLVLVWQPTRHPIVGSYGETIGILDVTT
jgi:hypothetical protein